MHATGAPKEGFDPKVEHTEETLRQMCHSYKSHKDTMTLATVLYDEEKEPVEIVLGIPEFRKVLGLGPRVQKY